MDHGTAFRLFTQGQPVSLTIDGRRVDGVMVEGLPSSSSGPGYMDLRLPTPSASKTGALSRCRDRILRAGTRPLVLG